MKTKEVIKTKKTKTNKKSTRVRAELSSLIGFAKEGFCEHRAGRVTNLRVRDGALCLRGGIRKAATLSGNIVFAQNIFFGGERIGFVSDQNALYAVYGDGGSCTCEKVLDMPVYEKTGFVFPCGKSIYLYRNELFYTLGKNGFEAIGAQSPVMYTTSNKISRDDISEYTNLLTGEMSVCITFTEASRFIFVDEEVALISEAVLDGTNVISEIGVYKNNISLPFEASVGSKLTLRFTPKRADGIADGGLGFIGCAVGDTGDIYAYNERYISKLKISGGEILVSLPIFEVRAENISSCFVSAGMPIAVVGNTIGPVSGGELLAVAGESLYGSEGVCMSPSGAYISTHKGLFRLSFSQSGSSYTVDYVSVNDTLSADENFLPIRMAYSPCDSSVYMIGKRIGESGNRIYSFDTQAMMWSEVSGISSPSFCFGLDDGVCIVSGSVLYILSHFNENDTIGSRAASIEGSIETCALDFLAQADRKRLISASASLGGDFDSFTLKVSTDSGRSDSFTYERESTSDRLAFPIYRMNVGSFTFAKAVATLRGRADASIHDVYIDIKTNT